MLSMKICKEPLATFSIVASDAAAGEVGVAVASKFPAVGAVVPWARGGVGAVATQAWANTGYGLEGLDLLAQGLEPGVAVERLIATDPDRESRQVGLVAASGESATFTGRKCVPWAGGQAEPGLAAQGNILAGSQVVAAMAAAFRGSQVRLARRLLSALQAGEMRGGDKRGRQSAALLVVKPAGGYGGFNDRYLDLRVDDHADPVAELARLLEVWELHFLKPSAGELVAIDAARAAEIQRALAILGYYQGQVGVGYDAATRAALDRFLHQENLEERVRPDACTDQAALAHLLRRALEVRE